MYERTPLSRGGSLDPNPLGKGEFIEHKYQPIPCSSDMRAFPMLKVGFLLSLVDMVIFITSLHPAIVCLFFQKAKATSRPVKPPVEGEVPVSLIEEWKL